MSEELASIGEPSVFVSSFFGGTARGRCIQLTPEGLGFYGHAELTERDVIELIRTLSKWIHDGGMNLPCM